MVLSETLLNNGNDRQTINRAAINESKATNNDSPKNCWISWLLIEPIDFLIPTSRARVAERAVLKFMKLIHARSRTNPPRSPNDQTIFICLLVTGFPSSNSEFKCHSAMG